MTASRRESEAWKPPVTDADVDELEASLVDDDLAVGHTMQEVQRARRLLDDRDMVEQLKADGFTGPLLQVLQAELVAYGMAVMMAWTRTGGIAVQCRNKGRPIFISEIGSTRWNLEDRLELSLETVAAALRFFMERVLPQGHWDPTKGASLRTFFIGACLLHFPNIYNAWFNSQDRWGRVTDPDRTPPEQTELERRADEVCFDDPTSEITLRRELRRVALTKIKSPDTRRAAEMIMNGALIKEAAEAIGVTPKALESRLYRIRVAEEKRRS